MLDSTRHLLNARVGSFIGSIFIGSFALFFGLIIWRAAHGTDPLAQAFLSTGLFSYELPE
jgi:hypothetical protein